MVTGKVIPKRATGSINIFRLLKAQANNGAAITVASTDAIMGVSKTSAAPNEHIDVQIDGVAYVEAGAAVAVGADVTSDSLGRGITASPAAGVNAYIAGKAQSAASAAGDIIEVQLIPSIKQG
jgi:Uncharacterized conserved protein (DUF2190)